MCCTVFINRRELEVDITAQQIKMFFLFFIFLNYILSL